MVCYTRPIMRLTFYFYDYETTSGSPRSGRPIQFAGQRTDEFLQPLGEPDNILIAPADDVLPEPDAVLVHGVTPQKALSEGVTEAEFAKYFNKKVALSGTIFVGYNNIRFDDEFTRFVNYRNFYDPYQWHWQSQRSRWDMLDVVRMVRALRPDGIVWPEVKGRPSARLEEMAKANKLTHDNAHDALSDVQALIELAQLIKAKQPKLFDYLLGLRNKPAVAELAQSGKPFVYTSGRYAGDFLNTTLVTALFQHPRRPSAVVYDLRQNPTPWFDKSAEELAKHWQARYGDDLERPPVKLLQYNRCPAVAPASVLDETSQERIGLDIEMAERHLKLLGDNPDFITRLEDALDIVEGKQQTALDVGDADVDVSLYDGFWSDADQEVMQELRTATPEELNDLSARITNKRLRAMIPRYKARNYPQSLSDEERQVWESYRRDVFYSGGKKSQYAKFSQRMQEVSQRHLSENDHYLLAELQLYAESILPEPEDAVA